MSRKDTILIAVIVNAGLLAILFATAIIYDPDNKILEQHEIHSPLAEARIPTGASSPFVVSKSTGDEVDNALNSYAYSNSASYVGGSNSTDVFINEIPTPQHSAFIDDDLPQELSTPVQSDEEVFVEVTVKKGDVLEKIAKANRTTVNIIKQANQLQSERLQIGQVLKIPIKKEQSQVATTTTSSSQINRKPIEKKAAEETDVQYYVMKSGDNPWKLARQFNVKYEDILRLNQLDEESARNLKVGDRIRVK